MAIRQEFILPVLLVVEYDQVDEDFLQLVSNGVKQCGLNIWNPSVGAARLHHSSSEASKVLVKSLMKGGALELVSHKLCVSQACAKTRKERIKFGV